MSSNLSILIVAPASSIHTQRWVNALSTRGFEIHLAYCAGHEPADPTSIDDRVRLIPLPYRSPLGYITNRPALKRAVRKADPDLVHAHFASGYGTLAAARLDVPTMLSVWGADVYDFPAKSPLHNRLIRHNLMAYSTLSSTSEAMKRRVLDLYPDSNLEISVVPFGVDIDRFRPSDDQQRSAGNVRVGTCKSLFPKYGIDILIQAFSLVHQQMPSTELHIAGDGPQREELDDLVNALGITDTVTFHGSISYDTVPDFLRTLDVFCALSVDDSESFGVAVVEAMAAELPTVVTEVDGFAEVTTDATSSHVPRRNPSAAATEIEHLCRSTELRSRLGRAGRRRVISEYDWDQNVDQMIVIYQGLVSQV